MKFYKKYRLKDRTFIVKRNLESDGNINSAKNILYQA